MIRIVNFFGKRYLELKVPFVRIYWLYLLESV